MDEWVALFRDLGFPVVVALYFMFRMERILGKVVQVLTRLEAYLPGEESPASGDSDTRRRSRLS